MNTTVAVILPNWMVWLLIFVVFLEIIQKCLDFYLNYLKRQAVKLGLNNKGEWHETN